MKIFNNKIINTAFICLTLRSLGVVGIFLTPACTKKKINIHENKKNISWNYNIGIEGIECKLCAYKMVKRLEKIESFSDVKIICTPNFRDCYATINWPDIKNNIPVKNIKDVVESEGFDLKYISGNFIGSFDDKLDKFNLIQDDQELNIKFINPNSIQYFLPVNQKTIVDAKLIFKKSEPLWITLN